MAADGTYTQVQASSPGVHGTAARSDGILEAAWVIYPGFAGGSWTGLSGSGFTSGGSTVVATETDLLISQAGLFLITLDVAVETVVTNYSPADSFQCGFIGPTSERFLVPLTLRSAAGLQGNLFGSSMLSGVVAGRLCASRPYALRRGSYSPWVEVGSLGQSTSITVNYFGAVSLPVAMTVT